MLLPWVDTQLVKGTLRWIASPFLRSAWQRIGAFRTDEVLEVPVEKVPDVYEEIPVPTTLWDRIQAHRWARVTDFRSYCCQ